jgi:uncharacterized protein YqgC (DUF456 family)
MKDLWVEGMMPMQLLFILIGISAAYIAGNFILARAGKKVPAFPQALFIWVGAYVALELLIYPPIPSALLYTYMGLITIVIFLMVSANDQIWTEFKRPIVNTLMAESGTYKTVRLASFVAVPILTLWGTYDFMMPKYEEPIELRTVHPAPPQSFTFDFGTVKGKKMMLQTEHNPYRVDEEGEYLEVGAESKYFGTNPFEEDAPVFMQHVREGGAIFFQNCHFCHGDNLNGQGMFSFAFNPIPANFVDPGTIAQLQETFVLWRVAKGGPGLPREGFPWASAMPPWEQHLTVDEIWKVIMFEYWHTGFFPRTWE